MPNLTKYAECEQFPYYVNFNYDPAFFAFTECPANTVWLDSKQGCVSIDQTGCRKLFAFIIRKLSSSYFSARTPLPCTTGCSLPSTNAIPSKIHSTSSRRSTVVKIYPIVNWNGCESIYVSCPSGFVLATYNSLIDYIKIYNKSSATVYCGHNTRITMRFMKWENEWKICSNTFDMINCIGLVTIVHLGYDIPSFISDIFSDFE